MTYASQANDSEVILTPAEAATASVIWLHGLGADGFDFAPVVDELRLPRTLPIRFIFPHAKHRPVTLNNGYVMRAWYDLYGLSTNSREDEAGLRDSERTVSQYIAGEIAAGIPSERIVIAGFSQGGALALYAALRYPQQLAGVIALSTYLPLRDRLAGEVSAANRNVPILMCHGVRDAVVPLTMGSASRDLLVQQGFAVEWHTYPMEHSVCMEEIAVISTWLQQRLPRNKSE
ncbi:MAG TPA: alpha/beta fold hydrolase [Steroidobacteraceae bacterium]|nr:alpha/beta fold hydrolase [Steroidobacteraceae bacterium]